MSHILPHNQHNQCFGMFLVSSQLLSWYLRRFRRKKDFKTRKTAVLLLRTINRRKHHLLFARVLQQRLHLDRYPQVDDMLHVSVFGRVQFDVVLGQNLHDGPDFQPPLCLWDSVPAVKTRWGTVIVTADAVDGEQLTQSLSLPSGRPKAGRWATSSSCPAHRRSPVCLQRYDLSDQQTVNLLPNSSLLY